MNHTLLQNYSRWHGSYEDHIHLSLLFCNSYITRLYCTHVCMVCIHYYRVSVLAMSCAHAGWQYICWAQSMDLHNPWIAQRKPYIHTLRDNPWIARAIQGSHVSKGAKYKFADDLWIALRTQTTDRLVCSQVQSNDKLQVSGIALAS